MGQDHGGIEMKSFKPIFIVMLFAFAASVVAAQVNNVHYRDNAVLAWDPVTHWIDEDGVPTEFLETDTVEYEIFTYPAADIIDDQNVSLLTSHGLVSLPEVTINFGSMPRQMYYAGARTVVTDGSGGVTYSVIAWSYDPEVTAGLPFAYIPLGGFFTVPLPSGLRDAGM